MSRHHETKLALVQNLAMMNTGLMKPSGLIAVCSALIPAGYTVGEIVAALDCLIRERAVEYPEQQWRSPKQSVQ